MSFQAYLDTIKQKTGLDPDDFRRIADEKGLLAEGTKVGEIVAWLATDFDLGKGHAMALVATFKQRPAADDRLAKQLSGAKARWQPVYESLLETLATFGPVGAAPTGTYVSLTKGAGKFAIVAFTADRMDVGIKLKGAEPTARFEAAGAWNAMVTHRVRVTDAAQVDDELLDWLRRAYEAA